MFQIGKIGPRLHRNCYSTLDVPFIYLKFWGFFTSNLSMYLWWFTVSFFFFLLQLGKYAEYQAGRIVQIFVYTQKYSLHHSADLCLDQFYAHTILCSFFSVAEPSSLSANQIVMLQIVYGTILTLFYCSTEVSVCK